MVIPVRSRLDTGSRPSVFTLGCQQLAAVPLSQVAMGGKESGDARMDRRTNDIAVMKKQRHLEVGPQGFNQAQQDGRKAEQVMLGEEEEDHLLGNVDDVDEDETVQEHGELVLGEQEVLEAS